MKVGELTLREAEELRKCCEHIGFIKCECWDCKYFDENECDCKLSFLTCLREIDLDQEIEVEKNGTIQEEGKEIGIEEVSNVVE